MKPCAYLASPWPGEDGGPQRLQVPHRGAGLAIRSGETLKCVSRSTLLSTMTVLGAPGEVYLLTHSALRARLGIATTSCVELIDPQTLKTLSRSPRLAGGPMWPGGMAIHRNGGIYVVYGRYAHRLDRACQPLAMLQLPVNEPYNSFVILDNGLIVTKNLSETTPARLTVIAPDSMTSACADTQCPEPSIARLSAMGNTVYVLGYDSANCHLQAWRFDPQARALTPLWAKRPFGCASHMLLYPDTGELVVNDHRWSGEEVAVQRTEVLP